MASISNVTNLIEFISSRRFPFSKSDVAESLEIGEQQALRYLHRATDSGWVSKSVWTSGHTKMMFTPLVRLEKR